MGNGKRVLHLWHAMLLALAMQAGSGLQAAELLTGVVGPGQAGSTSLRTITLAGDWQVTCDRSGDLHHCRMTTAGSTKTVKAESSTVQLASDSTDGLFYFLTPLDLLVARGVEMRIDGGKVHKLAYRSCHAQGCVIPFRMTSSLDRSFRRGSTLVLRLFELDASPIDVEISLLGFIEASRIVGRN